MSDEVTAIIQSAAASLDAGSGGEAAVETAPAPVETTETTETPAETTTGSGTQAPEAKTPTPEEAEEAELSALEKELVGKDTRLGNGRISVSRHQAVLTRQRRQAEASLAEVTKKYDALKQYEDAGWQDRARVIQLAENDQRTYFSMLQGHAAFKPLFEELIAAAVAKTAPAPKAEPELEEPRPNILLPDGTLSYDADALAKLRAYDLAQIEKKYQAELEKVRGDLKPIKEKTEREERLRTSLNRADKILENARTNWPGYKENEAKIAEALDKNPKFTLEDAYRHVVITALKGDAVKMEAEIRARLVKQMDEQKTSRAVRSGLPEAGAGDGGSGDEVSDIIRNAMRSIA